MGVPTKYRVEMCDKVVELMKEGRSKEDVAAILGLAKQRIYDYAERYPKFRDAIKKGEELSALWWREEGRKSLRDKDFNSTLWYMNMKNRHNWADKQEVKQDGELKITINTAIPEPDEE